MRATKFNSTTPWVCHGLDTRGENRKRTSHKGLRRQQRTRATWHNKGPGHQRVLTVLLEPGGGGVIPFWRQSMRKVTVDITLELGFEGWKRFCRGSMERRGDRALEAEKSTGETLEEEEQMLSSRWGNILFRERTHYTTWTFTVCCFGKSILISDVKTFSLCTSKYCNWSDRVDM